MNDLFSELRQFINVFTPKRVLVLVIILISLVLICGPRTPMTDDGQVDCDVACPMPEAGPVITIPTVYLEEVSQENWQFDLPNEGWVYREPSVPAIKVVVFNKSKDCMVLLIKEETDLPLKDYAVESLKGFSDRGQIVGITWSQLSKQKSVLFEGRVADDEIFWSWNTVKDGFGYSLCCFYTVNIDAGLEQQALCQEIAESFQIK